MGAVLDTNVIIEIARNNKDKDVLNAVLGFDKNLLRDFHNAL